MVAAKTIRRHTGPSAVAIVPARLGSTRLPRKMLLRETGRFLFEHTVENALSTGVFERVVLATDSDEILRAAKDAGIEVLMTSADHQSGTDRVHEAYESLAAEGLRADVIVNIQGDEPELEPEGLQALTAAFTDPTVELATLYSEIEAEEQAEDPATVKLIVNGDGDALYFSRAKIPVRRDASAEPVPYLRHIGVYAFRPEALREFCELPPGRLERSESLEQLRWLEAGRRIRCVATKPSPAGIDTLEHYAAFKARLADRLTFEKETTS